MRKLYILIAMLFGLHISSCESIEECSDAFGSKCSKSLDEYSDAFSSKSHAYLEAHRKMINIKATLSHIGATWTLRIKNDGVTDEWLVCDPGKCGVNAIYTSKEQWAYPVKEGAEVPPPGHASGARLYGGSRRVRLKPRQVASIEFDPRFYRNTLGESPNLAGISASNLVLTPVIDETVYQLINRNIPHLVLLIEEPIVPFGPPPFKSMGWYTLMLPLTSEQTE